MNLTVRQIEKSWDSVSAIIFCNYSPTQPDGINGFPLSAP